MLILDFETKSRCDLVTAGTYNYVTDPSTDILCCAFLDTETQYKEIWYPDKGEPSKQILYMLNNADMVVAHYAEFDQGIYECIAVPDYGFPEIPREKWYCSAAQMRVNAIPAGLDDAAWALGLTKRKHAVGASLIKALSIPNKDTGLFNLDPELHEQMREYCMQDVIVTEAVVAATRMMTQNEHADWLKTCEINERGIKCDLHLARLALSYAGAEQAEIGKELAALTDGAVTKHTQSLRIKNWILKTVHELHPVVQQMTIYKNNVAKLSLDKNIRRTILDMYADDTLGECPEKVLDVIACLDDGNKSSVAKFKRMLQRADKEDHRVRGAFVFAGATQTLRFASRGLQLHNMKRDCWSPKRTEEIKFDMMRDGHLDYGNGVMDTLSKLLRPALIPDTGKVFVVGDWSSIEARALHWGTDTLEGDVKLEQFADGVDVYQEVATDLKLEDRQQGKVVELSAGYQGGYRAFQAMARNYGVKVSDTAAQAIIDKWRDKNYHVVNWWAQLQSAAAKALEYPGQEFKAGMVKYLFTPNLMGGTLICIMPGDHFIQYPMAKLEDVTTPWGETRTAVTCMKAGYKPKADAKNWPRVALYGGLLCENFCQAFSAALLRNALRELPEVVAHVHDEIVMEIDSDLADEAAGVLRSVMETVPDWAEGLPLNAEPSIMTRYGKG